ncbi:hypothetical protein BOX15_Mlig017319g2, partial [Macrostomum lignano]
LDGEASQQHRLNYFIDGSSMQEQKYEPPSPLSLPQHSFMLQQQLPHSNTPGGLMSPPGAAPQVKRSFTKSGVVHRKKCRHPKTPADLLHRFCLVCGAKAENYNFGVISCESCKAFFRRNAHKKTLGDAGFSCSFQHARCEVTLATRKKCPGCRLAKCFRVGMQADLIQKGEVLTVGDGVPSVSESAMPSVQMRQSTSNEYYQYQPAMPPLTPPPVPPPQQQQLLSVPTPSTSSSCLAQSPPNNARCWQALWYHLHNPVPSEPSPITDLEYNEAIDASDKKYANVLLVDFIDELQQLVAETMLCNIATPPSVQLDPQQLSSCVSTNIILLEVFVRQAVLFVRKMRQINLLERQHFLQLIKSRIHSVIFPLSCAGLNQADDRYYFTINGQRVCCQPIEMFSDLVRQSGNRLIDYSPLSEFRTYARYLGEATEMRHDLLALFCATKLLHLPPDSGITDPRLVDACKRLSLRYHQHMTDTLFYHFPFDYEEKLQLTCRLFKWSETFDSTLDKFILYCPLQTSEDNNCMALRELRARDRQSAAENGTSG